MASDAVATRWRSGACKVCSIKHLHRSRSCSTMSSWSMGFLLMKKGQALGCIRIRHGSPTYNSKAHPGAFYQQLTAATRRENQELKTDAPSGHGLAAALGRISIDPNCGRDTKGHSHEQEA